MTEVMAQRLALDKAQADNRRLCETLKKFTKLVYYGTIANEHKNEIHEAVEQARRLMTEMDARYSE